MGQYGKEYSENTDGYVYAHFPGTEDGNAWFEQNDAMWLGRVRKGSILDRTQWQVWCGKYTSGDNCWSKEDTIAESVFRFPLHTAVQQVNYEPTLGKFVFGNWAWLDSNGNPKPQQGAGAWPGGSP